MQPASAARGKGWAKSTYGPSFLDSPQLFERAVDPPSSRTLRGSRLAAVRRPRAGRSKAGDHAEANSAYVDAHRPPLASPAAFAPCGPANLREAERLALFREAIKTILSDGSSSPTSSVVLDTRRKRLAQLRQRLVAVSLRSRSLRLTRTTRSGALAYPEGRLDRIDLTALRVLIDPCSPAGGLSRSGCSVAARAGTHARRATGIFWWSFRTTSTMPSSRHSQHAGP
jgi:hypothetical protein